ncbi:MAG: DUF416 family protein [Gammaproteobacteria bacterium]|nr:MAG: DUF416 family protein [Gammaproteobacteria bacterium]
MLKLISEETIARPLSLSANKKVAFMLLLYERMAPELRAFASTEKFDLFCVQRAREEFWRSLTGDSFVSWSQLREDILGAAPDSEVFGSLAASFALNAALVAAEIAGFLADGQDNHILEAIGYARDSLHAKATMEMEGLVYNKLVDDYVEAHPLVQQERRAEEEDVGFLSTMQDPPWSANIVSMLKSRAEAQQSLVATKE